MNLRETRFLFIDCQTTGMSPASGDLLEIAWLHGSAADENPSTPTSLLVQLPGDQRIPYRIREITGIEQKDMDQALAPQEVFQRLQELVQTSGTQTSAMIHYAQFERAFLDKLFTTFGSPVPFKIVCTAQISRRLLPNIPSRNIRALLGIWIGDRCFKKSLCPRRIDLRNLEISSYRIRKNRRSHLGGTKRLACRKC